MTGNRSQYGTLDVAKLLGVSAMTVVRWIDKGLMPAYRTPGNHRRIRHDDLKHFIRKMGFPLPPQFKGEPKRILVVDDEPDVISVMLRCFEGMDGVSVSTAVDGVTALMEIGRVRPDILFLDLVLPELNGIEVCRRIRESIFLTTRVVAVSGKATAEMRDEVLAAGAELFLEKPVSIHTIRAEVARMIREDDEP